MRYLIIVALITVISCRAYAQPKQGYFYLRTNPLSLIDPLAGGPTLGAEYFITDHFSLGTDVGLILYEFATSDNDSLGLPKGYRIKPELRFYLYKKNREKRVRLFFGLEGLFLKTTTRHDNSLPVFDNMGNVVYRSLAGYDEEKTVAGGVLKAGIQIPRFISKRMLMEVYLGPGVRVKKYDFTDVPTGASVNNTLNEGFFLNTDVDGTYPSLSAGIKFVYRIN